jgi:ketosteroid isomerase-like protein
MKQLLTLLLLTMLISCGQRSVNLEDAKKNILFCWNDWEAKAKAGDPSYYWSDDVIIMGQGLPAMHGKQEFKSMFTNMQKMPGFKMVWDKEPSVLEISKDGQMAYLLARNEITITDSTGMAHSGFNQAMQVWKKDKDGNWKATVSVMYPEKPMK